MLRTQLLAYSVTNIFESDGTFTSCYKMFNNLYQGKVMYSNVQVCIHRGGIDVYVSNEFNNNACSRSGCSFFSRLWGESVEPLRRESFEPLMRETVKLNLMLTLNLNLLTLSYKYIVNETAYNTKSVVDIHPLIEANYFRSRCTVLSQKKCNNSVNHEGRRERESSRISGEKLCRLFTRSRKLRKIIRKVIKRNITNSSHIHRHTQAFIISNKRFVQFIKTKLNCNVQISKRIKGDTFITRNEFYKEKELDLSKTQTSTYKNLNHRVNYCKLNLNGDIEVNPGPGFINPANTIHTPFSQGNVDVFGQNAGRQCVPMSLCFLIYINRSHAIVEISDLVNIMQMGNELYTALSQLSRQTFLLLTELPAMVTVEDTHYSLEFSQSYTGNLHLHINVVNENIPFVMPLDSALEQLQQESFNSFLLTIEYNTVSIFIDSNGLLKVFDSHARDSFGMPHPLGTCVLLEFNSITNLIEYFKSLYRPGAIYELMGVKIINVCNEQLQSVSNNEIVPNAENSDTTLQCCTSRVVDKIMNESTIFYKQDCSYFIYSICFSTIMTCNYWTDQTLQAIVEHAVEMYKYDEALNRHQLSINPFPDSVLICGSKIDIVYSSRHERTLYCTSVASKIVLEKLILANTMQNNGFLIWYLNCSLGCIIHNYVHRKKEKTKYFLIKSTETDKLKLIKPLPDAHSVVNQLCDTCGNINQETFKYILQFLSCPTKLTKSEKQKIMRKHTSISQKERIRQNKRKCQRTMSPTRKKVLLENMVIKYNKLDPIEKNILLENKATAYKEMGSIEKEAYREKARMNMKRKHEQCKRTVYTLDYFLSKFHEKIKEGPYYICSVCNRLLYRKSVTLLERKSYCSVPKTVFTKIASFDKKEYICTTCHAKVSKGRIPCQAAYNDMCIDEIPAELSLLEKLEQILIAQRIVFEKIIVMPKGQQKKVAGAICNVPVNCDQTCDVLPRPPERSGIIMLKLKRKLSSEDMFIFKQYVPNSLKML